MGRIEPEFVPVWDIDPVPFVLSVNMRRRHLTLSQRAVIAAEIRPVFAEKAKERQRKSGGNQRKKAVVEKLPQPNAKARDEAGASLGVSGKSVDHAKTVLESGNPDLIEAVKKGELIQGAERYQALKTVPIGTVLPERESQIRELCRIESNSEASEVAVALLEKFGVKKQSDITADNRQAFLDAIKEAS